MTSKLRNAYVAHKDFESLYIRKANRWANNQKIQAIDIALIRARKPGKGSFGRLIEELEKEYPTYFIFVENVHNKRFADHLVGIGFRDVGYNSYLKEKNKEKKHEMDVVRTITNSIPRKEV